MMKITTSQQNDHNDDGKDEDDDDDDNDNERYGVLLAVEQVSFSQVLSPSPVHVPESVRQSIK